MKSARSILALVLLNAAWLAAASYFIARHYREQAVTNSVRYVTNYVPVMKPRATLVTNVVSATNDFRWSQVESEDYRTYITRLRSIGCPEQTIRDIIIADVDKLLAPRIQSASLQPRDLNYWEPIEHQLWDNAAQREAFQKQRAVDFEKREVIRELLGIDLVGERLKNEGHDDYYGARLQFLPEEKRARMRLVLDQFSDQERALMEQQIEADDANAAAELHKVQQEKQVALAQLLTPKEKEQYDLWFSRTASATRESVYGFNASEEEFLKLYNLRRNFEERGVALDSPEGQQQFNTQLQQALGPDRYAQYLRAQDPQYRSLLATTTRFGLQQKVADDLHEFTQVAQEQRFQVAADPNLTPVQKTAAQGAITDETERAFKEALGEKAFRFFSKRAPR